MKELRMLNFWKTKYPFNDFVLVTQKKGRDESKKLSNECKVIGLDYSNTQNIGNYSIFMAATQPIGDYQNIVFSGVAQHDGKFYYGQADLPHQVDENLGESVGIFTAIIKNKNRITITQDFMGCGTIFYAKHNDNIFCSNRYHLLLQVLANNGFKGEFDKTNLSIHLYKNRTAFLESNFSSQMDIKGVYQLPIHQEIILDNDGIKFEEKSEFINSFVLNESESRENLLEKASEELIQNIQVALDSKRFTKAVVDLSGGKDSRLVFAGVLNINNALEKVEINTKNVPNSQDLEIASGLKNLFGARFYKEEGRSQKSQTVSESLEIWRSYFMGTYYRLGSQAWTPKGESKVLRLSGGIGEIYDGFWLKNYKKFLNNPKNEFELASQLVAHLSLFVSDENKKDIAERIAEEIRVLPGKELLERFENYYLYFRNRYHFGMRAYEYYHDTPIWFPMLSKSMFKLSMSNFKERGNSKLEWTNKLHPLLIWIDYDKKAAADNPELSEIGDIRFKNIKINSKDSCEEWATINAENRNTLLSSRPKMSHEFNQDWRDSNTSIKESIISVFIELKQSSADFNKMYDESFVSHINEQTNTRYLNEMYARLFSIKDQLDIFS